MKDGQIERFALERDPFPVAPDGLVLNTPELAQRVALVVHFVTTANRPVLIVGEPGAGRSTFLHILTESFPSSLRTVVWQARPQARPQDLLLALSEGFGIDTTLSDLNSIALALADRLTELAAGGTVPTLLVDDADTLSEALLELLAGLDRHGDGSLQLVLAGTHALTERTGMLAGRRPGGWLPVVDLPHLSPAQAGDYLNLRLAEAGWRGDCPFDAESHAALVRASGGRPGALNRAAGDWLERLQAGADQPVARRNWRASLARAGTAARGTLGAMPGPRRALAAMVTGGGLALAASLGLASWWSSSPPAQAVHEREAGGAAAQANGPPSHDRPLIEDRLNDRPLNDQPLIEALAAGGGAGSDPVQSPAAATVTGWAGGANRFAASALQPLGSPAPRPNRKPFDLVPGAGGVPIVADAARGAPGRASTVAWNTVPRPRPPPRARRPGQTVPVVESRPSSGYVIQLVAFAERDKASRFVADRRLGTKAALYPVTSPTGKVLHAIVLQGYPSRDAAAKAIEQLPTDLRSARPWVRPLGSVLPRRENARP